MEISEEEEKNLEAKADMIFSTYNLDGKDELIRLILKFGDI